MPYEVADPPPGDQEQLALEGLARKISAIQAPLIIDESNRMLSMERELLSRLVRVGDKESGYFFRNQTLGRFLSLNAFGFLEHSVEPFTTFSTKDHPYFKSKDFVARTSRHRWVWVMLFVERHRLSKILQAQSDLFRPLFANTMKKRGAFSVVETRNQGSHFTWNLYPKDFSSDRWASIQEILDLYPKGIFIASLEKQYLYPLLLAAILRDGVKESGLFVELEFKKEDGTLMREAFSHSSEELPPDSILLKEAAKLKLQSD